MRFFISEALRSVRRNAVPSFAALAAVLVTVLVLGVFIPIMQATTGAANEVRSRVLIDVYLSPTATDAQAESMRQRIMQDVPHVKRVQFISKAEAYREEQKRNPDAYRLLGGNPLPDMFRITPDDPANLVIIKDALTPPSASGKRTVVDPIIDEVKDRKDETAKIITATRVVKITMAALAILLVLAAILLIANTIRLSLFSRRREIEVMKLVGATDWFIRWPFVLEGMFMGAVGGGLAIILLAAAKLALIDPLAKDFALIAAPHTMSFSLLVLLLSVASIGVAALGSGLSIRRYLRV